MIRANGIEWGNIFMSGGANGFVGEGYHHHRIFPLIPGTNVEGATHATKTLTLPRRMPTHESRGKGHGNLVLDEITLQPKDKFPDCINVNPLTGEAANCVSLSNPGIEDFLERKILQELSEPFVITYTPVANSPEERLEESRQFACALRRRLPEFRAPFAICISFCPNTGHCYWKLSDELIRHVEIFKEELETAVFIKINVLFPVPDLLRVERSGFCDAVEVPNALPHGALPEKVDWEKLKKLTDPVVSKYGTCGYSGPINYELSKGYIYNARFAGSGLQFIGGGVDHKRQVKELQLAGADAIAVSRMRMTRFWRSAGIIAEANRCWGGR